MTTNLYDGSGRTLHERGLSLPPFTNDDFLTDPRGYQPSEGLTDAVNVALMLGQPLLLTGDPGSGKTQLAYSLAHQLELWPPLLYYTKSTSTASELFYRYDALRHFQDVQLKRPEYPIEHYIEYRALGTAIHRATDRKDPHCPDALRNEPQVRSVVLIDEIDKAPRDLPNDLLNELEDMIFQVKETGVTFRAAKEYKPILVMTSNQEKDLPEAFRRRCVFYHIPFPKDRLDQIVRSRLDLSDNYPAERLQRAIDLFLEIRSMSLEKRPSTAELLGWIRVLDSLEVNLNGKPADLSQHQQALLAASYTVLVKGVDDMKQLRTTLPALSTHA